MARYTDAVCRQCRREGQKLFLKGDRCYTDKCGVDRRPFAPGQHGQGRNKKLSEYGMQLREKQKARRYYGVLESQFHKVDIASYLVKPGQTITLKDSSRSLDKFKANLEANGSRPAPKWLDFDKNTLTAKVVALPVREDIDLPIEEHLIVELYSK